MEGIVPLASRALEIEKHGQDFDCIGVGSFDTRIAVVAVPFDSVLERNVKQKRNKNRRIRHLAIAC